MQSPQDSYQVVSALALTLLSADGIQNVSMRAPAIQVDTKAWLHMQGPQSHGLAVRVQTEATTPGLGFTSKGLKAIAWL